MKFTVRIDDKLMSAALEQTGLKSKTEVLERALRELLERDARRKLKALYGAVPELDDAPRRRSPRS